MPGHRIAGKILVIPDAERRQWRVVAINTGQQPLGITHNILPPGQNPLAVIHDDHAQYGHGMPVAPDPTRYRELFFTEGGQYNGYLIEPNSTLRVGLRGGGYHTLPLGPLDGPPTKIDIREDFTWYNRGGADAYESNIAGMDGYERSARQQPREGAVADIERYVDDILSGGGAPKTVCKGSCVIEPVPDARGGLSHWTITFKNDGAQDRGESPFIGTVAFDVDVDGKKGLESMGVPYEGSRAVQRISNNGGGYAVVPRPGAQLRVGVRGFGFQAVALPQLGQRVALRVEEMARVYGETQPEFFDVDEIVRKREEKGSVVAFADAGQELKNIAPVTLRGARARQESDFSSPHLRAEFVPPSLEQPLGGWQISITSRMPAEVNRQAVGFIGTVQLNAPPGAVALDAHRPPGKDMQIAPPKKFTQPGEEKTWFIPLGHNMNGVVAAAGERVRIGTRGLGWFTEFALPVAGELVDSDTNPEQWGLRTDQVNPDMLTHQYVNQVRD